MTDGASTEVVAPEVTELPPQGNAAFIALMDALAPEPDPAEAGAADAAAGTAAGEGAAAASGAEGDGATGGTAAAPDAGGAAATGADAGAPGASGTAEGADAAAAGAGAEGALPDGTEAGAGDGGAVGTEHPSASAGRPAEWVADAAELIPKFGELSTGLEEKIEAGFRDSALTEVRTEYVKYFEALEKHPRLLVGQEVPAADGSGNEVLRDSKDAAEWQEAIKTVLIAEVHERTARAMESNGSALDTLHQSIELFQNNPDLVPGTKGFDVELANRFVALVQPYEVRTEDKKLNGYSIPVQPILNQLRTQITAERAKAPAAPAAAAETKPAPPAASPPQAGIRSKAGDSSETNDFSTLFGTIGLPNLQI